MATPFDVVQQRGYVPPAPVSGYPMPIAPVATTPATTTSPASTEITYGYGNDQFLTDSQQRLADSVRHAFDVSLAQRDRDLLRYGLPQLSSNYEDEALARAIATANLANRSTNPYNISLPRGIGGGGGGGGGGGRGGSLANPFPYGYNPYLRTPTPDPGRSWQSFLSGATSLLPLLFGKNGMNNLFNKGIVGIARDMFGNPVAIDQNGQPIDMTPGGSPTGSYAYGMDQAYNTPMDPNFMTGLPDYTNDLPPPIDYGFTIPDYTNDLPPPIDTSGWGDFTDWGGWGGL